MQQMLIIRQGKNVTQSHVGIPHSKEAHRARYIRHVHEGT